MDNLDITTLVRIFTLQERMIVCAFRKETGLNKTAIETLLFAGTKVAFTAYNVQSHFKHTNVQIVRRALKSLSKFGLIERVGSNKITMASVYMVTRKGRQIMEDYYSLWYTVMPAK